MSEGGRSPRKRSNGLPDNLRPACAYVARCTQHWLADTFSNHFLVLEGQTATAPVLAKLTGDPQVQILGFGTPIGGGFVTPEPGLLGLIGIGAGVLLLIWWLRATEHPEHRRARQINVTLNRLTSDWNLSPQRPFPGRQGLRPPFGSANRVASTLGPHTAVRADERAAVHDFGDSFEAGGELDVGDSVMRGI